MSDNQNDELQVSESEYREAEERLRIEREHERSTVNTFDYSMYVDEP